MMKALAITLVALTGAAHAAGTVFTTLLGDGYQSYASAVASDAQGNTYVAGMTAAPDFPTTIGVFQPAYAGDYDAFVAKLGPDGKVIWANYLGGSKEDWANAIAIDSSGNVWVAGYTESTDFPLVNPIQAWLVYAPGAYAYAFVSKLSADGSKLLYSTLLGSTSGTTGTYSNAAGIAVDSSGNAYVAVNATSASGYPGAPSGQTAAGILVTKVSAQGALVYSYFHPGGSASAIALDSSGAIYVAGSSVAGDPTTGTLVYATPPVQQAMAFKLSSDGSAKLWEKALGSSAQSAAAALAIDPAGEVWIAGSTSSANFPTMHALQSTLAERPLWEVASSDANWTPVDNLPFALPQTMVVDPTTSTTLYMGTYDLGVFKSVDSGATWNAASNGMTGLSISELAIDPAQPQTLFAATPTTVYKSTDGAVTWAAVDTPPTPPTQLLVDAQNPNNIYDVLSNPDGLPGIPNFRTSQDGGVTWSTIPVVGMVTLAIDPRVSGHLFAVGLTNLAPPSSFGQPVMTPVLYTSTNGGATWNQMSPVMLANSQTIVVDASTNPSTVYYGLQYKSTDGGVTWTSLPALPGETVAGASNFAADPAGNVYAVDPGGIYVSHDHAQTWIALASPVPPAASVVPAGTAGKLFALAPIGTQSADATAGFVSKISADGSSLEYSTYLRGHEIQEAITNAANEPAFFQTQNWISGIALDSAGDAIVTGGTRATDFPTANPLQSANAGQADAFAAVISADGSTLKYSTYLGGSHDDGALAAAVDSQGNVILAGETWSGDFPITNGPTLAPFAAGAFVAKLAIPTTPVITSVVNGASFQPGIAAGSWVAIQGTNLANTTRTWQTSDFSGKDLPTLLSGVSVTIDGEPAFVEYISPTQINVLAPSDSSTGTVNVVVNNNGMVSVPAPAQLQTYAPAFFLNPGTTVVAASVIPGYVSVSSTAPANPGDLVVLWGTGFGPTNPPAAAGTEVSGAPATSATPIVTVGGMQVQVISSVLTTGGAGLYQITIQLPANVSTGAVAVQASIGGAQTQAGATIFIGQP